MKKRFLWIVFDLTVAVQIVLAVWIVNYKIPQEGIKAVTLPEMGAGRNPDQGIALVEQENRSDTQPDQQADAQPEQQAGIQPEQQTDAQPEQQTDAQSEQQTRILPDSLMATNIVMDTQDWHEKFADKFTDTVIATDTSYTSPDLSIQLSYSHYDTGILDKSSNGKHVKYGTEVSYVLADIYVGDITCFQTAFAQDTYGVGYSEKLTDMSSEMKSVLAVNGDSYSNNRHQDNGTIIRNGVVYRNEWTDMETCVLNWDGTMDIYGPDQIDIQQLIEKGAYQSWIFGPGLLDENGKAKKTFLTWSYIQQSHPRTAIGYYEPGHYCLLLVDGRQKSSRGMFLEEMAKVFEDLGCKAAYNLDGGHCSFMTFEGETANHPYKPEHEVSDGIFITERL